MNVLHITTSTSGGAGIACTRLHQNQLQHNLGSTVLCLKDYGNVSRYIPNIYTYANGFIGEQCRKGKTWLHDRKLKKQLHNRPSGFEIFSLINSNFCITKHPAYLQADIVHLHWVSGFLDFAGFFKNIQKPVVWTLHDMFPFTGGCHHADGHLSFMQDCMSCPQLIGTKDPDLAYNQLSEKKKVLQSVADIQIVAPSNWLLQLSQKSSLFSKYPHELIRNSVPATIFYPIDKTAARKELGLPVEKKIIFFAAQSVNDSRKGMNLLLEALKMLNIDLFLLTAGNTNSFNPDLPVHSLGIINDPRKMALAYNAADVFVLPSVAENLPNTIAESLMCGTPVIGFRVGGIPEMIANLENGSLCNEMNSTSLADTITKFFKGSVCFSKQKIADKAIKEYGAARQVEKYQMIYERIFRQPYI